MKMISVKQAAARKGVRRDTINKAIHAGKVNAQQVGRSWVVFDDEKFAAYNPGKKGPQRISQLRCPGCGRSVVRADVPDEKVYRCIRCRRRWAASQVEPEENN